MEGLPQDLRYAARALAKTRGFTAVAVRMLRNNPGFTAVAVLTLALGIGANTAIFSVVSPILFEPLPYPHANRIMVIWDVFQGSRSDVTFHTYRELAARSRSFEALSILERWRPTMSGRNEPERSRHYRPRQRRSAESRGDQRPVVAAAFRQQSADHWAPHHTRWRWLRDCRRDAGRLRRCARANG